MHRLKLASVPVGSDRRLADVDLAYTTHGRLDADGDNCIVLPTYYTGSDESYLPWIGPGCPFDSDQWYVVVPNMIGNSRSTACDARTRRGWDPRTDPVIDIADNVAVQRRLLEYLGVQRVALVAGWSMGGLQAYEWAVAYPDLVDAILPICASARCWPLNAMFLQGIASFLEQALELSPGRRELGLAAFGRAYASWAFSGEYFRDELWRQDGFGSIGDLLTSWAEEHLSWNPADLLTMLRTWQHADPTRPGETLQGTLGKVATRAIVMPSTTDMYFTLAENAIEVSWQPEAELRPIESAFGHVAGRPGHLSEVTAQVRQAVVDLLG